MNIEQPTQGRTPTIENTTSSSSSDTNDNYNNNRGNQTASLTRKRKRFPLTKQHILSSNTTLKQRLKHNVRLAKQQRLSPSSGRLFSNRPLALKPLSAPPYSGYDAKICYSDDSSDDSSDNSSGNRVRHLKSIKRPISTVRPYRLRKHKRKRSQGIADEDDEYEVEKILNACVYRKKLQY
ncbi:hypothetical protein BDW02DRAFT_603455 [Decorospora gaudefroyi]|uniref:Uncharacterized protein n=1 Tax=Decorospora gaudefroyi TaxID=184978 RepID=A0A6A5JWM4_9PLEO|nr:hypothetical protein BDW02DRAFT_603455 [Decorospora gaudefroyi]